MFCEGEASSSTVSMTILELGCGDGRLLRRLLEIERAEGVIQTGRSESLYIGIEYNDSRYNKARSLLERFTNVKLLNGSFEELIHEFADSSIDKIICVLPDPEFIDIKHQDRWKKFYSVVKRKLAPDGCLRIVTELTDDLLQPVPIDVYRSWIQEIIQVFRELEFFLVWVFEGSPPEYESECLDRFKKDPERIRLATFDFAKNRRKNISYTSH
ncbi:MAG: class I SAM-dependent methyltransferase [Thermoproteota archaeon]|jgi:phospholipid N-methyltransferase|nr:class I SAM-dependent methyltransferase [Thermoproteota archaeon]